jgi:pyruvate/2-oxoglutarate/acetoin dehydrogenase E1 component
MNTKETFLITELEIGSFFKYIKIHMKYKDELIRSMEFLAEDKRTIFIGQSVKFSGNAIFNTLESIDDSRKIETPVFEDVQMGISTGLALDGFVPVTCYPRFDFLICASNQLVNHLDKIEYMSKGTMRPRVIIRTSIGPKAPLDGGPQHTADYTEAFKKMLTNINIVSLEEPEDIFPAFEEALLGDNFHATLLIENGGFYNEK